MRSDWTQVPTPADDNRQFLWDLFAGPFRGHAIIMDPHPVAAPWPGDVAISGRPVRDWLPYAVGNFEARVKWRQETGDDSVPYANIATGTEVLAAAFGCPVHLCEYSHPAARPVVRTAQEADALATPGLTARTLERVFEFGHLLRCELGPEVPIGVPDLQSPFDIAALVWRKQDLFIAMHEKPEAVKRLVGKCQTLLNDFLTEFKRQFPNCNLIHCPLHWAPPELGCALSEDEAGSMSTQMFKEFCLPSLANLSQAFGGLFVHCCAAADHQYEGFKRVPNLRGMNRVFQSPGPRPAIEAFSGSTVLVMAWVGEQDVSKLLDMSLPDTRFLFNMGAQPIEESKRTYERLRLRCPRQGGQM